jgi:hypothetical protein
MLVRVEWKKDREGGKLGLGKSMIKWRGWDKVSIKWGLDKEEFGI